MAQSLAQAECRGKIEAENGASNNSQLARAALQHVPGLPAGIGQRLVGDVGAELTIGARLSAGAGPAMPRTAVTIGRAAAEVPLGAGPQPFFSSSSNSAGPRY